MLIQKGFKLGFLTEGGKKGSTEKNQKSVVKAE